MQKLVFYFAITAFLFLGFTKRSTQPAPLEPEAFHKYKFFQMAASRDTVLGWGRADAQAVWFSEQHSDRLIPKDEVRLTNYVYSKGEYPRILDSFNLKSTGVFITIKEDKQFASYGYNRSDLDTLVNLIKGNSRIAYLLFRPKVYPNNPDFMMYEITPADASYTPLVGFNDKERTTLVNLQLNPSPPAKPRYN